MMTISDRFKQLHEALSLVTEETEGRIYFDIGVFQRPEIVAALITAQAIDAAAKEISDAIRGAVQ